MRKLLIVLILSLVTLSFTACREKAVEPDNAFNVVGLYNVYQVDLNGQFAALPQNNVSATLNVVRQSNSTVSVEIRFVTATERSAVTVPDLTVVPSEANRWLLRAKNEQLGLIQGTDLTLSVQSGNRRDTYWSRR